MRAREYAEKAITIHEVLNVRLSVARAQNNLGLVLIRRGDLKQARKHLDRSLRIFEETGVELGKSPVLLSLVELELDGPRKRPPEARYERSFSANSE